MRLPHNPFQVLQGVQLAPSIPLSRTPPEGSNGSLANGMKTAPAVLFRATVDHWRPPSQPQTGPGAFSSPASRTDRGTQVHDHQLGVESHEAQAPVRPERDRLPHVRPLPVSERHTGRANPSSKDKSRPGPEGTQCGVRN